MAWQPGVRGGDAGRHGEAAHRYRDGGAGTRKLVEPFLARDDERGLGAQLFERLGIDGRVIGARDADQLARDMRGIGERPHQVEYRSEEHTSELQSLMRISYAVFCLKKKTHKPQQVNEARK